jgi:hypothetical protein
MAAGRLRARWLLGAAALLAVGSVLWVLRDGRDRKAEEMDRAVAEAAQRAMSPAAERALSATATTAPELPPITVLPVATELGAALLRKDDPARALEAVEQLLYFYRQGLGENPVGQNEDIVAAMLGENPKRAAYLAADSPAIKDGRLIDPWGTPYWFHPVSRQRMEIRSAGPDRDLFTGDDLHRE